MLREVAVVVRIGKELVPFVPVLLAEVLADAPGQFAVMLAHEFQTHGLFQQCGFVERLQIEQVLIGTVAVFLAYGFSGLEIAGPVAEKPVRDVVERSVGPQILFIPAHDTSDRGQQRAHIGFVPSVHPVVVDNAFPCQAETADVLWQRGGVAAGRDAVGLHGPSAHLDGLFGERDVAGVVEGDHGLDACVTEILQLLIIGTVHVGFVGTQACRAPAHFEHLCQVGIARGGKLALALQGIGAERPVHVA